MGADHSEFFVRNRREYVGGCIVRIFGQLWDAPVCDGKTPEPPPVGQLCISCGEPIQPDDQGYIMACFTALDSDPEWRPQHRECSLLHVIGHSYGYCRCTDYRGLSERQAALALWEEFELQRFTAG